MQTSGQPLVEREKRNTGWRKEEEKGKRETNPTEPHIFFFWSLACLASIGALRWKELLSSMKFTPPCKTRGNFRLTVQSSVLDMSRCFDEHWSTRFLSGNDSRGVGRGLAVFRCVKRRAPTQNRCYPCDALVAAVVVHECEAPHAKIQLMRGIRGAGVASFRHECVSQLSLHRG